METLAFVLGIFGFVAFCALGSLKSRISALESALRGMEGSSYAASLQEIAALAAGLVGKQVQLSFVDEEVDADVVSCAANAKGTITLLDADEQWLLVRLETKAWKAPREKLIRLETISGIAVVLPKE